MPRLLLHAGLGKTGSTSIQRFLNANMAALSEQGVLFRPTPDLKGRQLNHNLLAMATWTYVQRIYADLYGADLERLRKDSLKAWAGLLDEFRRSDHHTLLVSGEFFSRSAIGELTEFAKAELADFDISVLFYLRQPSAHYVSRLQQQLKYSSKIGPFGRKPFRYARKLERWEQIGDVTVREFRRSVLVGGDVIDDFASAFGVETAGFDRPNDANESISAEGMDLMLEYHRLHWPDGPVRIRPESLKLIRQIRAIEAARAGNINFTSPRLNQDLAAYLDFDVEELTRLDLNFGFRYSAIGEPAHLTPTGDRDDLEGRAFDSLDQLITINPEVRAQLRAELVAAGAAFDPSAAMTSRSAG